MKLKLIILLSLTSLFAKAQYYPSSDIRLNHIQIMFEYPQVKGADNYKIQLALNNGKPFEKSIIAEYKDSSTAHLVNTKIQFGTAYRWKCIAYKGKKVISTSAEQTFFTNSTHVARDFKQNLIQYDSLKCSPGLIFYDYGLVTDRRGKLILVTDSFGIEKRDFSLTQTGSITYVMRDQAYDKDLNGNTIWQSKSIQHQQDKIFGYHHDIIKLNNGNYLVLCKVKDMATKGFREKFNEAIVEVDAANNVKWLWKENDHIDDTVALNATHYNSLYLTSDNKVIVSGRDFNSILFIDKASGKIDKSIGYRLNNKHEWYPQYIFNGQHHAQLLPNGDILLFNNNTADNGGKISSIIEINNPNQNNKELERKFFYFYDFPDRKNNLVPKGGGVIKMKNSNYLISSSANNNNFEITPESQIVWHCRPEKRDTVKNNWLEFGSYRMSFAPDLYPSFFTLEWIYQNDVITGYKIVNKGSLPDEYEIVTRETNGSTATPSLIKIEAGKTHYTKYNPATTSVISVKSISNPGKPKELKLDK